MAGGSANLTERLKAQQQITDIEVKGFSGLSLKNDGVNQPAGVWQQLDNFDLYVPGSIRKVLPAVLYGGPYLSGGANNTTIQDFIDYFAQPNANTGPTVRTLGIGLNSTLTSYVIFNLATGAVWLDTGVPRLVNIGTPIPTLLQAPVFFVPYKMRSWQKATIYAAFDAILKYDAGTGLLNVWYISTAGTSGANEPVWSASASPVNDNGTIWTVDGQPNSSRYRETALIILIPGYKPFYAIEWQYNPNAVEVPKVYLFPTPNLIDTDIPPQGPVELGIVTTTPNLNGYAPSAGRAYSYTFYNPNLLHETSPAPIAGDTKITQTDAANVTATIIGSLLDPLGSNPNTNVFSSYQEFYAAVPALAAQQAQALGYTSMYLYGTKDGGTTLYRITQIFDDLGNVVSNSDGSCSLAVLLALQVAKTWKDYFPLPTPQALRDSIRLYEGSGPLNFAPDPVNFGDISWSIKKGNALIVQPGDAPSGNAAIELQGTGAALGKNIMRSVVIRVTPGTQYYFQGFIDAFNATAGTFRWDITAQNGTVITSFAQLFGVEGTVSGTFTPGAGVTKVRLQAFTNNANAPVGTVVMWADPVIQIGAALSTVPTNYPTKDTALVVPSPAPLSQGVFPSLLTGTLFQGSLFGVDFFNRTRVWYSNNGDVLSVAATNFFDVITTRNDSIFQLIETYDRLIIGKQRQLTQITGPPFVPSPVDPQHGIQAGRGAIAIGNALIGLLNVGLALIGMGLSIPSPNSISIGFRPEDVIGDVIKPLTDSIKPSTLRQSGINSGIMPCLAVDNTQNIFLFEYETTAAPVPNFILMGVLTHKGPSIWSRLTALPTPPNGLVRLIKEIQLNSPVDGTPIVGVLAINVADGKAYQLFAGTQDGTITATAVTWPFPDLTQLPIDLRDTIKTFNELWVEGQDIPNFQFSWSTDGKPLTDVTKVFSTPRALQNRNVIGANGRQIVIKFTHAAVTTVEPRLSYMKLRYNIGGQAAGGPGAGANY